MNKISITLDPGHGEGYNPGYNSNYREGTKMFTLAYFLKEELEKYDLFEVHVTRKTVKEDPSLSARGAMAITNNSKVFISLHSNGADASTAHGIEIFRSLKRPDSEALAQKLLTTVVDTMKSGCPQTYSRGVKTREYPTGGADYYGVIRNSVTSSIVEYSYIIEHGFHSNPEECAWLIQDENLRKLAVAEAKVLADNFGARLISDIEEEKQMEELKKLVAELSNKISNLEKKLEESNIVYSTIDDIPDWAKESIIKVVNKGFVKGTDNNRLDISYDLVRTIVILDRAGMFD